MVPGLVGDCEQFASVEHRLSQYRYSPWSRFADWSFEVRGKERWKVLPVGTPPLPIKWQTRLKHYY